MQNRPADLDLLKQYFIEGNLDAVKAELDGRDPEIILEDLVSMSGLFCLIDYAARKDTPEHQAILDYLYNVFAVPFFATHTSHYSNFSLLHLAVFCRQSRDVLSNIPHAKDMMNDPSNGSLTPLAIAARIGNTVIMPFLVSSGAEVNPATGPTAIYEAAEQGQYDAVVFLLEELNANPNYQVVDGENFIDDYERKVLRVKLDYSQLYNNLPLHIAAYYGYTDIVKVLIEVGHADYHILDNHSATVLNNAIYNAYSADTHADVVSYLLTLRDIDVNYENVKGMGYTPLEYSIMKGNTVVANMLAIDPRVDINKNDRSAKQVSSALHHSIESAYNSPELREEMFAVTDLLLRQKALVNQNNNLEKVSPLHLAVQYNMLAVVQLLLDYGANTSLRNAQRQTPADIARANGANDILAVLESHDHAKKQSPGFFARLCGRTQAASPQPKPKL